MNKARRKVIDNLITQLLSLGEEVERIKEEEEETLDNMPDSLRDSERANISEEAISCFDEVIDLLEQIESNLETAKG